MRVVSVHRYVKVLLIGAMFLTSPLSFAQSGSFSEYPLGAGDLLSIKVFGEEDLSIEVLLSDAGTVSYPFLGELRVLGLTIGQLSEIIRTGLADGYLINPSVNVAVMEYRQFYINGEVKEPGGYPFQPGLTLQRAVALAGGFTERASRSKVFVVHEREETTAKLDLGSPIRPGDIITVHESFF
jgi:polysaccharide biosynthesis/export protein VpsN